MLPRGLYAIADAGMGDPLAAGLELLGLGCPVVQLRCKGWTDPALLAVARVLVAAANAAGALLIVNDRVEVAVASAAHGVHLGQDDGAIASARQRLGPGALLGRSTHDLHQVQAAGDADYLGFGPVFQTATKLDHSPVTGVGALAAAVASTRLPVVAIGGIDAGNLPLVRGSGAYGWAVVGALAHADDRRRAIEALR